MSSLAIAVAAAVISAIAAIASAAISAFTSWMVSRNNAAQKLAEMREAWVDDLRNHLADFVGAIHRLLNEGFSPDSPERMRFFQEQNAKIVRIETYISMKLNHKEKTAQRLIDAMSRWSITCWRQYVYSGLHREAR